MIRYSSSRAAAAAVWIGLAIAAVGELPAQEPPAPANQPSVSQLLRQLHKEQVAEAARPRVIRLILQDGESACRRLYKQLYKGQEDRGEELGKEVAEFRQDLERAALRQVAERQSAEAARDVAAARDTISGLVRDPALSKGQMYGEGDTALGNLEKWLQADVGKLLQEGTELRGARQAVAALVGVYRARQSELSQVGQVWLGHRSGVRGIQKFDPLPLADGFANALESAELDARVRSIPAGSRDRSVLIDNEQLRGELPTEEWRGILETNRRRLLTGRGALKIDTRLCAAARDHSKDMATIGFFAHQSPVEGKRSFSDRAANFKTSARSENIARGQRRGADAVQGWWHSPGHFRNMMGGHGRIGLGGHGTFWTQMFG